MNFLENPSYRGLGASQVRWAFTSTLPRPLHSPHPPVLVHQLRARRPESGRVSPGERPPARGQCRAVLLRWSAGSWPPRPPGAGKEGRRVRSEISAAAAVAALVLLRGCIRVEPVARISGRADVLCGTFALLAHLGVPQGRRSERRGARPGLVLAAAAGLAAAILSEGSALPLPAALLLLDVYPLRRLHRLGAWTPSAGEASPAAGGACGAPHGRAGAPATERCSPGSRDYGLLACVTVAACSFSGLTCSASSGRASLQSPLYEMPARVSSVRRLGSARFSASWPASS